MLGFLTGYLHPEGGNSSKELSQITQSFSSYMKISEFQKLIKDLYIEQDKKRGRSLTFIWLIEEIGELANIFKSEEIDEERAAEEIADIIAWTTSLANLLDINLESAILEKYPYKCIKCNSNPCICGKRN